MLTEANVRVCELYFYVDYYSQCNKKVNNAFWHAMKADANTLDHEVYAADNLKLNEQFLPIYTLRTQVKAFNELLKK